MTLEPCATMGPLEYEAFVDGCDALIAAGAAGIQLLPESVWQASPTLQVAIDLNAVPPAGIAGLPVTAAGDSLHGKIVYGAIGTGNLKMKIHKHCIRQLFETNDLILDIEQIHAVGQQLEAESVA